MLHKLILVLMVFSTVLSCTEEEKELTDNIRFGLVANSQDYQIYRSRRLGVRGLNLLEEKLKSNNLPFPKTIIFLNDEGYGEKGRYAIGEYKASLESDYGFKFYHTMGDDIQTYLDGTDPRNPSEDIDEKGVLSSLEGSELFSKNLRDDGNDGGMEDFYTILDIVLNPENQPVLFHCHGGGHRAGMVAMTLRHIQGILSEQSPTNLDPIDGIVPINEIEVEYHSFFERGHPRHENIEFIRWFVTTEKFQEYVEKYRNLL